MKPAWEALEVAIAITLLAEMEMGANAVYVGPVAGQLVRQLSPVRQSVVAESAVVEANGNREANVVDVAKNVGAPMFVASMPPEYVEVAVPRTVNCVVEAFVKYVVEAKIIVFWSQSGVVVDWFATPAYEDATNGQP